MGPDSFASAQLADLLGKVCQPILSSERAAMLPLRLDLRDLRIPQLVEQRRVRWSADARELAEIVDEMVQRRQVRAWQRPVTDQAL
ncbi:hypothetical protein GCM10009565_52050 [Amycolatopsis albidoflavus]